MVTNYAVDMLSPTQDVLLSYGEQVQTQRFTYGLEMLSMHFQSLGDHDNGWVPQGDQTVYTGKWETLYALQDELGSLVKLIGENGKMSSHYNYDEFGRPEGAEKFDPNWPGPDNVAGYTGYNYDYYAGLYYANARYYMPEVGRFISEDPWNGTLAVPNTLNPYPYVLNNPLKYVDPLGLSPQTGKWGGDYVQGTGNPVKVISPVWQDSDKNYSDMIQAKLLELNFQWYFAGSVEEQNAVAQQANDIRQKANSGAGWWLDHAKQITEAAANEFSWFLGGSVSTNERDKWLEMNQWFQSDLTIKDDQTLAAGMFIAGMLTGGGEGKLATNGVKSWIKHATYNEVRNTLGKEGVEKFIKAMNKGIVGATGESGIKMLAGKGIEAGGQYYKYEIKVLSKGTSHYRILGNLDEKTGHIIFERLENLK